jgi:hypothetical protein
MSSKRYFISHLDIDDFRLYGGEVFWLDAISGYRIDL